MNINPTKTILVPFTRKRKVCLTAPTLQGIAIPFSDSVKYLGVTLDKSLNWNEHLDAISKKSTRAHYACQRLFGRTWGLRPQMVYWSFNTIVRPMVTYAALVWWTKVDQNNTKDLLKGLYRLACIGITGASRTCPTDAIGALLHLAPLHISIKEAAFFSSIRLQETGSLKSGDLKGHIKIVGLFGDSPITRVVNRILPIHVFERHQHIDIRS